MKKIFLLISILLSGCIFGQTTLKAHKAIYKFVEAQNQVNGDKNVSEASAELIFTKQVSVYKLTKDSKNNSLKYKL